MDGWHGRDRPLHCFGTIARRSGKRQRPTAERRIGSVEEKPCRVRAQPIKGNFHHMALACGFITGQG